MATEIQQVPFYHDTTEGKLNGLIQYLYHPGEWNDNKPFQYDLDDPLGTKKPNNKLISNYLKTRKGNCVSMPILVQSLGERLGLDMALSTAPLHIFVKLHDQGNSYNVETTAGGLKANNSYIKEFEISFTAMRNELYLQSLDKKEALAIMLTGLGTQYLEKGDLSSAQIIADLMLNNYPNYVSAMHLNGNIWHKRLTSELDEARSKRLRLTPELKKRFDDYLQNNLDWFERAEKLGWQEPPSDYDERYLKMIEDEKGK